MDFRFEPHLVEAVTRRHVDAGRSPAKEHYRRLYDALVASGLQKDAGRLESLYRYVFLSAGLERPLRDVAAEFPAVRLPVRVSEPVELEGCVLPDSRAAVLVRVRPERFDDLERLVAWLRHEWMHVADMLDPGFDYPPEAPPLDPPSRERFAFLWGAHADARLERSRRTPWRPRERWQAGADRFWAAVEEPVRRKAFDAFWAAPRLGHSKLVEIARDPRLFLSTFAGVSVRGYAGGRCPLCGFSTFRWILPGPRLTRAVADRIRDDFPRWDAEEGVCERCAEMYEIKAGLW